jgi:hypothetical protein
MVLGVSCMHSLVKCKYHSKDSEANGKKFHPKIRAGSEIRKNIIPDPDLRGKKVPYPDPTLVLKTQNVIKFAIFDLNVPFRTLFV